MAQEPVIEAVPRQYAFTGFRSTLEADWAATLDGLGIVWSYEPKVIDLPSGARYIPDFWLPMLGTWIEVKGPATPRIEKAYEFAETLACSCPPPPASCVCDWEGGQIVIIGRPAWRPLNRMMRHGSLSWSGTNGSAFLTECQFCRNNFWVQPRTSWRCRHCRVWKAQQRHLGHLRGAGEVEFRHADRIVDVV